MRIQEVGNRVSGPLNQQRWHQARPDQGQGHTQNVCTERHDRSEAVHRHGRFLPNLSEVIQPLNALLHQDVEWTWGPAQQEAFERAKLLVTRTPTLAFFELNRPTVVCTDASQYGLGGVLCQEHKGEL